MRKNLELTQDDCLLPQPIGSADLYDRPGIQADTQTYRQTDRETKQGVTQSSNVIMIPFTQISPT